MTQKSDLIKRSVDKLAKNKQAKQTDAESKAVQKAGQDMAAPNDNPARHNPDTGK